MKTRFLVLSVCLMGLTSCNKVNEMNCLVNSSTDSIQANIQTVQTSTMVIQQNAALINQSTRTIEENRRLLESIK